MAGRGGDLGHFRHVKQRPCGARGRACQGFLHDTVPAAGVKGIFRANQVASARVVPVLACVALLHDDPQGDQEWPSHPAPPGTDYGTIPPVRLFMPAGPRPLDRARPSSPRMSRAGSWINTPSRCGRRGGRPPPRRSSRAIELHLHGLRGGAASPTEADGSWEDAWSRGP